MAKKILAIIVSVAVIFTAGAFAVSATGDELEILPGFDFAQGDVNLDRKVNIKDATLIQKYLAQLSSLIDHQISLADVDGKPGVSIRDVTHLQKWLVGLADQLFKPEVPVTTAVQSVATTVAEIETSKAEDFVTDPDELPIMTHTAVVSTNADTPTDTSDFIGDPIIPPTSPVITGSTEVPATTVVTDPTEVPATTVVTDPTEVPVTTIVTDPTEVPVTTIVTDPTEVPVTTIVTDPTEVPVTTVVTDPTEVPVTTVVTDPTEVPVTTIVTDPTEVPVTTVVTDPTEVPVTTEVTTTAEVTTTQATEPAPTETKDKNKPIELPFVPAP